MKTQITTSHTQIGYGNNVQIIEDALREQFGLSDCSYVMRAVAAHIWSTVAGQHEAAWGIKEIRDAIHQVKCRIGILERQADGLRNPNADTVQPYPRGRWS